MTDHHDKAPDANDIFRDFGPDALRNVMDAAEAYTGAGGNGDARTAARDDYQERSGQAEPEPQAKPADTARDVGPVLHWHGEKSEAATRPWLVEGLLPETGIGLVSGQWGTYKTFCMLDLAASIMAGAVFIGAAVVRRGGVLFIAAEGASEIPIRLQAVLQEKYPALGEWAPFAWLDFCPRLLDSNSVKTLAGAAGKAGARMRAEWGVPLALIAIDTLVASAGYTIKGEENDPALGQVIMNQLAELSRLSGAFVLGVDHFGKAAETGTRGASSKEGSADVVLALLGDKAITGAISNTRLAVRKNRAGPSGQEFPFAVRVINLGDEQQLTSLVIDWAAPDGEAATPSTTTAADKRWSKSLRSLRRVLINVLATDQARDLKPFPDDQDMTVRAVDVELVRIEFYRGYLAEGDAKAKQAARRQAFHRAIKDAQERQLIGLREIDGTTFVWLAQDSRKQPEQGSPAPEGKQPEQQ
jgi:AAA domain